MGISQEDGVLASTVEIVEIEAESRLLHQAPRSVFSEGELAYARARPDPQRRLAARLAAKRAAVRLLGGGAALVEVEVRRSEMGPPVLALAGRARERLKALGGRRALVSLTHERAHAGALVVLVA